MSRSGEHDIIASLRQHYRTIKEAADHVALLLGEPNLGQVMAVLQQRNGELAEENRVLKAQLSILYKQLEERNA